MRLGNAESVTLSLLERFQKKLRAYWERLIAIAQIGPGFFGFEGGLFFGFVSILSR